MKINWNHEMMSRHIWAFDTNRIMRWASSSAVCTNTVLNFSIAMDQVMNSNQRIWECLTCGTTNEDDRNTCKQCGSGDRYFLD